MRELLLFGHTIVIRGEAAQDPRSLEVAGHRAMHWAMVGQEQKNEYRGEWSVREDAPTPFGRFFTILCILTLPE